MLNPNLKAHKAWLISKYSIFYGFFPHNSRAFKNLVQKSKRGHFSSDWRAVIEWFATPNFIFIICISHFGLFPVYKMLKNCNLLKKGDFFNIDYYAHLLLGAFLLSPVRGVLQHGEERRVGEADDRHPHQHVLEPKLLDQSPTQSWTWVYTMRENSWVEYYERILLGGILFPSPLIRVSTNPPVSLKYSFLLTNSKA